MPVKRAYNLFLTAKTRRGRFLRLTVPQAVPVSSIAQLHVTTVASYYLFTGLYHQLEITLLHQSILEASG